MIHKLKYYLRAGSFTISLFVVANPTLAQIIPDQTLPVNSVVTSQGNINLIEGGTKAGNNLFHSFQQFSVLTGTTAHFQNEQSIQNILTRVTGNSISQIDGLLKANGNANLFLINPNGIIFGNNAALDIGGSFIASTANSIKFPDGNEFSAINSQATPILSVNVPLGLQFPGILGNIINRAVNLQVLPGKTLSLIGGDISLENGNLTAAQGRIEIGSVGANSFVSLNPITNGWSLGYNGVNNFGNIQLLSASTVSASGEGGGNIQVQGGQVALTDSSKIVADTTGNQTGGEIFVSAKDLTVTNGSKISVETSNTGNAGKINIQAELVEVSNASANGQEFSTIAATSRGSGDSGSITINTNRLSAKDGGDISVTTFNAGKGGNLTVNANESVELIGDRISPDGKTFSRSGLFAATEGTEAGGNLTITTPRLVVKDGARVSVSTRGRGENGKPGGKGGNLTVFAPGGVVELSGTSSDGLFDSGLFALSGEDRPTLNAKDATGDGGNLRIETQQLLIRNGSQVSAATAGTGKGGNITVIADAIEVTGASAINQRFSTLAASSRGAGDSGNISINTRVLKVTEGADVSVTAFGTGSSGEINVGASELVELNGAVSLDGTNFSRSGLFAATEGTKPGGNLTITTLKLVVQDGARVSVSTRGRGENGIPGGRGGNLIIQAANGVVELSGTSTDGKFPSGLFALSGENRPNINANEATGDGGDLSIETKQLIIRDGAQVSTETAGAGKSGNINIVADAIAISGRSNQSFSTLAATSRSTGDSGNITINTNKLQVTNGADVSVTAFGTGRSGELLVTASDSIELIGAGAIPNSNIFSRSGLFAATEGTKDGGSLTINTARLVIKDGARISVSTRGKGDNNTPGGRGGNLIINASDAVELSGFGEVQVLRNNQLETLRFDSGLFALSGEPRPNIAENEATGAGGDLQIKTGLLNILNNAEVSASARGSGVAGNLDVEARNIKLQDGSITGATVGGNGANINLQVQNSLQLRGNSEISTTAGTSGNGGNITINADTLAVLQNSSIRADAGIQGGKVQITTQGLFGLPGTITASSALGTEFNGVVDITTPDVTTSQNLIDIPQNFLNPDNQVAQACTGERGENKNQFFITGRGGLPPTPTEPLSSNADSFTTLTAVRNLPKDNTTPQLPRPATGFGINSQGEIILTANATNAGAVLVGMRDCK
ncbi:MAG TPA: filamentous hemagglutinin N-terminal domain-containing protein [Oculatellaceae cyanobacterium]|jgi:filamentous hemagglutinin family protein